MEGRIIKYYREKAKLTQKDIVQGICSITHISKIEREITEYSSEIVTLLCKRLQIDMKEEKSKFYLFGKKMEELQHQIILQNNLEIDRLKAELEKNPLKDSPDFYASYSLTFARYYLYIGNLEKANQYISDIHQGNRSLSIFEENFLKHNLGIYYFLTGRNKDCIRVLTNIDHEIYHQNEYYYHLAVAHYVINQNVQAYYYGEKAASYFHKTMNVHRMIDAETLLLVQLNAKSVANYIEIKERYEALFRLCDACGAAPRKAKAYHNFAYDLHKRQMYEKSHHYYLLALSLVEESDGIYLMFLENFIGNAYYGNILPAEELMTKVDRGLEISQKKTHALPSFHFTFYKYLLSGLKQQAFQLIENTILPYYRESGDTLMIEKNERLLFYYYAENGKTESALKLARNLIPSSTLV
ncbi:helix-turn-helix domain-containing protein [Cytobacillus purgationiresistens]|uniref:Transcriptional regulator with XRE-family HTH domain n=1 Tax=Cytobacillus purgationiresistens TaxID=863449 RepID=A0ABU0AFN8_9BACI|nr:helix-turn-helix transcriptional regulator [Cytobacillus purgationiresistens]MDQ0270071.1 transcriptional regulator with XRE-family HTH domain [Cytobacillus purgationiresistens]